MMPELGYRVAMLEMAEASRRLSYKYGLALDDVDLDALRLLFADNAVLEVPGARFEGHEAVMGFFADSFASSTVTKRHFMCNVDVVSTGPKSADMTSRFIYTFAGDDTSVLGWGNYVDEIAMVSFRAVFTYKRIEIDMHADSRVGWATS